MRVTLSSSEQGRLNAAQNALLSPLNYDSVDAWRSAVNQEVEALLGADKALFMLPISDGLRVYSDEYDPIRSSKYPEWTRPLAERHRMWSRAARMGVADRPTLWGDDLPIYYQSRFYNEFIVPRRAYHALFLTHALDDPVTGKNVAQLVVHHDSPRRRPFGERGRACARLLYPAFVAGVEAWRRLRTHQVRLARIIDRVGFAARLCDSDGQLLHQTPALTRILEAEPATDRIRHALEQTVSSVLDSATQDNRKLGCRASQTVTTSVMRYEIYSAQLQDVDPADGAAAIACVSPTHPWSISRRNLKRCFGLTERQAEVAQLLALRKSNDEIADALFISTHTARHHTEAVLQKLQIHSRRDVFDRILAVIDRERRGGDE